MAKSTMVSARLSEIEEKKMARLTRALGKGKSEVMRAGLNLLYKAFKDGQLEVKPKRKKKKKRAAA